MFICEICGISLKKKGNHFWKHFPEQKKSVSLKISSSCKGRRGWMKGKSWGEIYGIENLIDVKRRHIENNSSKNFQSEESRIKVVDKLRGRNRSEEVRQKISDSHKGIALSEWHKKRIFECHADFSGEKSPFYGRKHSLDAKERMSNSHKGRIGPNKGAFLAERISSICIGCGQIFIKRISGSREYCSRECYVSNHEVWNKGIFGSRSYAWKGGISFFPYSSSFNEKVKKEIKDRDKWECCNCHSCGDRKGRLAIHHIDYNKQNNDEINLITLCYSCNSKANFDRKYWTDFYKEKIKARIIEYS